MPTPTGDPTPRSKRRPKSRSPRRSFSPWKHGHVPVVGLVGGIGAGKSTVANLLAAQGAHVLDADKIGHVLIDQTPARERVVATFGPDVLKDEPTPHIDRVALGTIVFSDKSAMAKLEAVLHPRMRHTFQKAIARAQRERTAKAVVLDAAVLFEAGWNDLCDFVVFVDATPELRLKRVQATRGWDSKTLAQREAAQLPPAEKRERADLVISNNTDPGDLPAGLEPLWAELRTRYRDAMARHHAARARERNRPTDSSTPPSRAARPRRGTRGPNS